MKKLKKWDEVKLKPEFNNDQEYRVAEVRDDNGEPVASLFPLSGGLLVSAATRNLVFVR